MTNIPSKQAGSTPDALATDLSINVNRAKNMSGDINNNVHLNDIEQQSMSGGEEGGFINEYADLP